MPVAVAAVHPDADILETLAARMVVPWEEVHLGHRRAASLETLVLPPVAVAAKQELLHLVPKTVLRFGCHALGSSPLHRGLLWKPRRTQTLPAK